MFEINVNQGAGKSSSTTAKTPQNSEYQKRQSELKKQIKPQAENLADLQNAAKIKKRQIDLAKEYNDNDAIEGLTADLKRIEQDIKRNTSVF